MGIMWSGDYRQADNVRVGAGYGSVIWAARNGKLNNIYKNIYNSPCL